MLHWSWEYFNEAKLWSLNRISKQQIYLSKHLNMSSYMTSTNVNKLFIDYKITVMYKMSFKKNLIYNCAFCLLNIHVRS